MGISSHVKNNHIMRNFMLTLLMIVGMTTFAQQVEPEVLDWDNPTVKIDDKEYTLIDVDLDGNHTLKFTRFTEDGKVIEEGKLRNRKPHGLWTSYNEQGFVLARAEYKYGKRKSFTTFREDGTTFTVLYKNKAMMSEGSQIAQVVIKY